MISADTVVGTTNFYKVEKPLSEATERKVKRRYKLVKKEEVLVETSNPINKYFPRLKNTDVCRNGKRKNSIDSTENLKKFKVWNRATD